MKCLCVQPYLLGLLMIALEIGGVSAASSDFQVTWCNPSAGTWTPMYHALKDWNATNGIGNYNYLFTHDDPDIVDGIWDWGKWLRRDLRKPDGEALCDFFVGSGSAADLWNDGLIADLTDTVNNDARFKWEEYSFSTRRYVAEYQGRTIGIPYQAEFPMFYYRRDIVDVPPRTWEDLVTMAKQLHGRDINNDNVTDYALCLPSGAHMATITLGMIGSIMKYETGTRQGWFYDLASNDDDPMKSVIGTPGYEYALDIISRLYPYTPGGMGDATFNQGMWGAGGYFSNIWAGRCSMWLGWASTGAESGSSWQYSAGKTATSRYPGSKLVYHRANDTLVPCTLELCPYMESGGINRPSMQSGGNFVFVRKTPKNLTAAVEAIATGIQSVDVRAPGGTPYRDDHYNVSWYVEFGWSYEDASSLLNALQRTTNTLHMLNYPKIPTFDNAWRIWLEAIKQTLRADEYENITKTIPEIVQELDANISADVAHNNYTMKEIENFLRDGFGMQSLREPTILAAQKNEPYWVIPVVLLLLILIALGAAYGYTKHAATAACPKDESQPFVAFFIGLKNEIQLNDAFSDTIDGALATGHSIVRNATKKHGVYIARRIGNVTLCVAKTRSQALSCSADIINEFDRQDWTAWFAEELGNLHTLRRNKRHHDDKASANGSTRSRGSEKTPSERSGGSRRSRRSDSVTAQSQAKTDASSASAASVFDGELEFALLPNIGMWYGLGTIVHEEERNTYSYSGQVVDCAAEIADRAKARQILVDSEFVDVCDEDNVQYDGRFSAFGEMTLRSKKRTKYDLQQYTAKGQPHIQYVEKRSSAARGKNVETEQDEVAGTISSALELSGGGLTTRRCAVCVLSVPQLRNLGGVWASDVHAEKVAECIAAIKTIADSYKGDVFAFQDGQVTIACNALKPCAAATTRVAHVALECAHKLNELGYPGASAGLAAGPAVVGLYTDEDGENIKVISGATVQRARVYQSVAAHQKIQVATSEGVSKDIATSFYTQSFDFIAWPEASMAEANAAKKIAADIPATPAAPAHHQIVHMVAVMSSRGEAAEDEWMYQLESGDATNPYRHINFIFTDAERCCQPGSSKAKAELKADCAAFLVDLTKLQEGSEGAAPPAIPGQNADCAAALDSAGSHNLRSIMALSDATQLSDYAMGRTETMRLHV